MINFENFPEYKLTNRRVITKRGVLWLGQTCNLRCQFCYFINRINSKDHPEHPFMTLEKAKRICSVLSNYYKNNAIDIQGGEPTIYKDIYKLVRYCKNIGLLPTLITNGIVLADKKRCLKFKEAGIRDFLFSVHGLGDTYDRLVGSIPGSSRKQMQGIDNCLELELPIRFNCVLSKAIIPQLEEIAMLAVDKSVRVVNFIAFNPFEDQQIKGRRNAENVPKYSEVTNNLNAAMDILEETNIECNVRYYPICVVAKRHRKSVYSFQQLPYDLHEWDYASWSWTGMQSQKMKGGELSPAITFEYATYGRYRLDDIFKKIKIPIEKFLLKHPKSIPRLAQLYHTFARVIFSSVAAGNANKKSRADIYSDNGKIRARKQCYFAYGKKCSLCSVRDICNGFHGDYAKIYGTEEAEPITDLPIITDPIYFIRDQAKVVEPEDFHWAI